MNYKTYIVRCRKHYPGYEIFAATSLKEAEDKCSSWKGCEISLEDIEETLHEYTPESKNEQKLLSKLKKLFSP